jgi:hypothetical protein
LNNGTHQDKLNVAMLRRTGAALVLGALPVVGQSKQVGAAVELDANTKIILGYYRRLALCHITSLAFFLIMNERQSTCHAC